MLIERLYAGGRCAGYGPIASRRNGSVGPRAAGVSDHVGRGLRLEWCAMFTTQTMHVGEHQATADRFYGGWNGSQGLKMAR